MALFISTGEAARLLGTTEPQLGELVRRGRIEPPPEVVAGRRLWTPDQILQAAEALDVLTDELARQMLDHHEGGEEELDDG